MTVFITEFPNCKLDSLSSHKPIENCACPLPDFAYIVEKTLGYKWMLKILRSLRSGINRPGAIIRATPGLTQKVLNQRLSNLIEFGIVTKIIYSEIPPHVEYIFTEFGCKFLEILDAIDRLEVHYQDNLNRDSSAKDTKPH